MSTANATSKLSILPMGIITGKGKFDCCGSVLIASPFRMEHLWPKLAAYFGMEAVVKEQPNFNLAEFMKDKQEVSASSTVLQDNKRWLTTKNNNNRYGIMW